MPMPRIHYRRADNPLKDKPKRPRHRFYHQDRPSFLADSIRGIARALRLGFHWSDTNYLVTKDGFLVNIHWQRPLEHGWIDPLGKLARNTPVFEMTLEEVERLRPKAKRYRSYRINTAEHMVRRAGREGLALEMELKVCQPSYERMTSVADCAAEYHTKVIVKTCTRPGSTAGAVRRLRTSHRAGLETMICPRGNRKVPKSAWAWIDYVRGPVRWTEG